MDKCEKDISNLTLSRLLTWEFFFGAAAFVFTIAMVWGSLNEKVMANSVNAQRMIEKQEEFTRSIEEIKASQKVSQTQTENLKDQFNAQSRDIHYVKQQVDEIKTLLIKLSRD